MGFKPRYTLSLCGYSDHSIHPCPCPLHWEDGAGISEPTAKRWALRDHLSPEGVGLQAGWAASQGNSPSPTWALPHPAPGTSSCTHPQRNPDPTS